ncbi:MAG: TRAP transporter substrate-binding protein DctP [Rhodobacteraceae bacterium]|nr:TRAP transporter substrate-binding protein DctP [Paracoccaceae bacterium]MCY4326187.1 TRAP transporter substrate-binding protein DctP [Paracoccaceae bacterium]
MRMFTKFRKTCAILGAVVTFLVAAITTSTAETIRYADSDPSSCLRCRFLIESYFPALEDATDGELQVKGLFGAVVGSNKENLKLTRDGVVQLSATFVGYHNNIFPAQSAFDLFSRGPREFANQLYFYRQAYARIPEIQDELAAQNLKLIMINPLLHLAFASRNEIESISDIRGHKWRAGTKLLLRNLRSAGASPVSVPWSEVYIALQTGAIDGVLTNYDGLDNAKFHEPAPHILISPELWMANPMITIVNRDYWDSLPPHVQQIWEKTSQEAELEWGQRLQAARSNIINSQRELGVTINELSETDLVNWENAANLDEIETLWIAEARAAGLENAAGVLMTLKEIHQEALARDNQ